MNDAAAAVTETDETTSTKRRRARFTETVILRCTPKQVRMLQEIKRSNRLDNLSQAARFALDEMVTSRTPRGASRAR